MPNNNLTQKEVTLISDLLTYEESACKKARAYAKCACDSETCALLNTIADSHEKKFNGLLNLLG